MAHNVLYYEAMSYDDDGKIIHTFHIIDDRNIDKPTLAERRLVLMKNGAKLYNIKHAIFFIGDLIKLASVGSWFIDNNGRYFQYKKQEFAKLIFKKIVKVIPINTGGSILEVDGIPSRFKTLYAPMPHETWAGVLKLGKKFILYGLYDQQYDNTIRKL